MAGIVYLSTIIQRVVTNKMDIMRLRALNSDEDILREAIKLGVEKNKIIEAFEKYYGVKYVDFDKVVIDKELAVKFNLKELKNKKILPYEVDTDKKIIYFAVGDITNQREINLFYDLCESMNYEGQFKFAFEYVIDRELQRVMVEEDNRRDREIEPGDEVSAIDWVNDTINKGIELNASDIHIEKVEQGIQVRYRVDGRLGSRDISEYDESIVLSIHSRIKIIGDMDTFEKRKPQEGRIHKYKYKNRVFDIRISTVNTVYGEKFVLRILEEKKNVETFSQLGFSRDDEQKVKSMLKSKKGIICIGGATGSGKTTSLYTMIDEINRDDINIYTIESPIERVITNINQVQINEAIGITYVSTLKALLRQDPDVIVVGEINDAETSRLSIRASLTGHLVLATIHANNAFDSISRLLDMGMEPYLIGASSIGFLSQILVRRLCNKCKEKTERLMDYEESWVKEKLGKTVLEEYSFYSPVGCEYCNEGYRGRIAIVEIIKVDNEVRRMLAGKEDLSVIREYINNSDFKSMAIDGIEKAGQGITTISELMENIG